jgi:alcohol dehydrogenase class IV
MSSPRVSFGLGSLAEVGESLARARAAKVLLVTGAGSFAASGAARALAPMLAGLEVRRFHEFKPNPILADLERGVGAFRSLEPDVVIAVGGGSAIDVAKAVNVFAAQTSPPADILRQPSLVRARPRPLVAVPTTAGTGSEATHFATLYADGVKHSFAHEWLRPDHAIVDPALTFSMPPRLTAVTGLDALSQAIESYWSVGATGESQALAAEAVALLWPALKRAVRAPDVAARTAMARGAHLAGRAIDISRTTAPHALSYALTIRHGVAHGHAVALTLGAFFEHNAQAQDVNDPRGAGYVGRTMAELCGRLGCRTPAEAARAWHDLLESLEVETDLRSLGVEADAIEGLVAAVNAERLANHPVRITPAFLGGLLRRLL